LINAVGAEEEHGPEKALLNSALVLFIHRPTNIKMQAKEERSEPVEEAVDNLSWRGGFGGVEAPADETNCEPVEDTGDAEEEGGQADGSGEASFAQERKSADGRDENGREENKVVILEAGTPID
jgi:hypothetical protein